MLLTRNNFKRVTLCLRRCRLVPRRVAKRTGILVNRFAIKIAFARKFRSFHNYDNDDDKVVRCFVATSTQKATDNLTLRPLVIASANTLANSPFPLFDLRISCRIVTSFTDTIDIIAYREKERSAIKYLLPTYIIDYVEPNFVLCLSMTIWNIYGKIDWPRRKYFEFICANSNEIYLRDNRKNIWQSLMLKRRKQFIKQNLGNLEGVRIKFCIKNSVLNKVVT